MYIKDRDVIISIIRLLLYINEKVGCVVFTHPLCTFLWY